MKCPTNYWVMYLFPYTNCHKLEINNTMHVGAWVKQCYSCWGWLAGKYTLSSNMPLVSSDYFRNTTDGEQTTWCDLISGKSRIFISTTVRTAISHLRILQSHSKLPLQL